MPTRMVIQLVRGELLQDGKMLYEPIVEVTVNEYWVDEVTAPVRRDVVRHRLTSTSAMIVQDGEYTLRYVFDGKQQEDRVLMKDGPVVGRATEQVSVRLIMYKVDVTKFREVESEDGFPKKEDEAMHAWKLFDRTIAELYSNPKYSGSYTVIFYAVGEAGEVPLRTELVNVPRT